MDRATKHIYDYTVEYAKKNPKKTALADEAGSISYEELERISIAIASNLSRMGVQCGERIAVYVPYVKEIVLGTFAAIRCGGVYVPMDVNYPKERLEFILKDSGAVIVLTLHKAWEENPLDFPKDRVIFMDDFVFHEEAGEGAGEGKGYTSPDVSLDAPAFILYTSGTTGRPKGVVLPHRNLVTLMDFSSVNEGTQINENTRAGIISGLTFSGTTLILYSPLMCGGMSILAPLEARKDLDCLYEFLRKERITHVFMASSLAATIAEHFDVSGINIFAGGEKLRNFIPMSKDTRIFNTYGCTEMGGILSTRIMGDEEIIPNGYLAPDSKALIVDENLNPVENGNVGELLISNDRMSREYLGLVDQTKDKWIEQNQRVWYRTGDRARCSEDGLYYVLGRTDNMVKIHGFRVETGEVEAQIGKAANKVGSSINNIVVVARAVNGIDHIVCYYEGDDDLDETKIVSEISKTLASYMVPNIFVRVDAMPRNANGKVMRDQLPAPKSYVSAPGIVYNEVESRVVGAVAHVLRYNQYISPEDGFAELGGTSLQSMELANVLRNMGISIGSADILKLNVLRDIAAKSKIAYERLWSDEEYARIRADFASRGEKIEKVMPITSMQDELLFEQIIHPDDQGLRRVFMLQVDSFLEEEELRSAFKKASEKYEELRSAIVFHNVTVFQQVITDREIPIQMLSIEGKDYSQMNALYRDLKGRPADLQKESFVQVLCVHEGEGSMLFVLDYMAKTNMAFSRKYLAEVMRELKEYHPDDVSIESWFELFEAGIENDLCRANEDSKQHKIGVTDGLKVKAYIKERPQSTDDIFVYSNDAEKKIVFVHTGNTGSEAYYSLAERLKGDFSFAVIEPFNLYHSSEAKYGIPNIAARYVKTLKKHQPEGPYIIGGWCYGGMVAHEMACQLQAAGDKVECLILLDSHVASDMQAQNLASAMFSSTDRDYFEKGDLFEDMRERGMLEALIDNSEHVGHDMLTHAPKHFDGRVLYFKPKVIPALAGGLAKDYWQFMKDCFDAGGYENYCAKNKLTIVETPHEHDLMMDSESLDIIVPQIYKELISK